MNEILIKTDAVIAIADKVDMQRSAINESFDLLSDSITELSHIWEGEIAYEFISKFGEIVDLNNSRDAVLKNYVEFIKKQVCAGYTTVESANKNIADSFK